MALNDKNKVVIDFEANTDQARAEIDAFRSRFAASIKETTKSSEGFYNVLNQVRIGLTQIGRGDIGGIPNLIRASVILKGETSKLSDTLGILDVGLKSTGATATTAKNLFQQFSEGVQKAATGTNAEARSLRLNFRDLGIDVEKALIRPDAAFRSLLVSLNGAKDGSLQANAAMDVLGIGTGKVAEGAAAAGAAMTKTSASFSGAAVAATGFGIAAVAAIAAVAVAVVAVTKGVEGILAEAKQVGTKSKEEFEKFEKAVKRAGGEVTSLDRALAQDLTRSAEQVAGAMDRVFIEFMRTGGPGAIILLKEIANTLTDLVPVANTVGRAFNNIFRGAAFTIEIIRQSIKNLTSDIVEFVENPSVAKLAIILGRNVAVAATQVPKPAPPPAATFDTKGRGKGGGGRDDISEAELQTRLLRTQQDEAQRALNGTREAAQRLFEITVKLHEAEKAQAASSLPRERAAKLAEIQQKEKEALEKYQEILGKISDDELKRIADLSEKINKDNQETAEALADQERALQDIKALQIERRVIEADLLEQSARNLQRAGGNPLVVNERFARAQAERENARFAQVQLSIERDRQQNEQRKQSEEDYLATLEQLNLREEVERRRHTSALADISRELQAATERLSPLSNRSLFGDNFANLREAGASNLQALASIASQSFKQMSDDAGNFATIAVGAVGSFTKGLGEMFAALVLGGETGPAALRKLTAAVLAQVAQQAAVKSIFELAAGFASLFFNPAEAAAHFTAAALYGSVAAVAGIGARIIAPASAASDAAGGGSSASGGRQSSGPRIINQSTNPQPVQIILRVEEGIVAQKVANSYANNGTLRQIIRNDLGANDR